MTEGHAARPKQRWFHRHRALALGGFVVAMVAFLDVVPGSALAALDLNPALHRRDYAFRMRHPIYHHGLRPRTSAEDEWGSVVHSVYVNSLGFKDSSPREMPLRGAGTRLLLIGDSFTEGIDLAWEDTFAGMLEERLAPRNVEVLNAGVVSYSPIIYRRKLEHLLVEVGLEVDHVIVFIDVSDTIDEALNYKLDEHGNVVRLEPDGLVGRLDRFIEEQTILMSTVRSLVERALAQRRMRDTGGHDARREVLMARVRSVLKEHESDGLRRGSEQMDALLLLLRERGIPLTVAVHPWPDQIRRAGSDARQVSHWRSWTAEHGVDFIDLFAAFMREPATDAGSGAILELTP
jgi:hypothetical protein